MKALDESVIINELPYATVMLNAARNEPINMHLTILQNKLTALEHL